MKFKGKVLKDDVVVFPSVEGEIFHHGAPGGAEPWDGSFRPGSGGALPRPRGEYVLVLADGQAGEITVRDVSYDARGEPIVNFEGSGPLR
jgi:hypothetical protein